MKEGLEGVDACAVDVIMIGADDKKQRAVAGSDEVEMSAIVWFFFFSSRRRHTRLQGDWSSDVCSSDLARCDPAYPTILRPPGRQEFPVQTRDRTFQGRRSTPGRWGLHWRGEGRRVCRDRKSVV